MALPRTKRLPVVETECKPLLAVWEITLRCDQRCRFCGTRAGKGHPQELSTEEALDVVQQLAEMGTAEVAVHGGEAYLRKDWLEIVAAIVERGMDCTMVTGGRGFSAELARATQSAGITAVSVSVDGTESTHDELRGIAGSHASARSALQNLADAGVPVGCNTQINRKNFRELDAIADVAIASGAYGWQVQLMVPMGRAADAEDLWLEPYDILEVMPRIAELRQRCDDHGVHLWPGNNVGYFGPYEYLLRKDRTRTGFSSGCGGGIRTIGIEANGDIKGCSAMASKGFVGGNVRSKSIREIWDHAPELQFTRGFLLDDLWGQCRSCYYAMTCKGGCIWTSSTLLGRAGNNPYCHHRALELLARGQREVLRRVEEAPGELRDTARFELSVEDAPAEWASALPVAYS